MKKTIILSIAVLFSTLSLFAQTKAGRVDTSKHATIYACPMHSEVKANEPGKCPKCGMDLNLAGKEKMKANVVKNYACPVHLQETSHNPGKCPKCGKKLNLSPKEQMKAEVTKTYTCPMHPDVSLDKDGVCPKCGKELVEKKEKQ
jgi:transcription initiation factor IIE alpha subunit